MVQKVTWVDEGGKVTGPLNPLDVGGRRFQHQYGRYHIDQFRFACPMLNGVRCDE